VLMQAIRDGLTLLTWQTDTFAYAETFDDAEGRYRGLRAGLAVILSPDDTGLIVKPGVARRQLEAEAPRPGQDKRAIADTTQPGSKTGTASPEPIVPRLRGVPRHRRPRPSAGRARCRPARGRGDRASRRPAWRGGLGDTGHRCAAAERR